MKAADHAQRPPTLHSTSKEHPPELRSANTVWGKIYQRTQTSKKVFTNINDIKFQSRDPIPGDYSFTDSNKIDDFLERLKYSLAQPTEMLSNTVGFWIGNELADKDWDVTKIDIPGFTSGFPKGYSSYK